MTTVAVGVDDRPATVADAARWIPLLDPDAASLGEWLFSQPEDVTGLELLGLRRSCPVRIDCSTGVEPIRADELQAAFICGYAHPNFRDLADAGHARLVASSPRWRHLFDERELVAIAATEPTGGTMPAAMTTAATVGVHGGWSITGNKSWISRIAEATAVVVFAADPDGRSAAFVAELPNRAITPTPLQPAGLGGWSWSMVAFDRLWVDDGDRLTVSFSEHFARYRVVVAAVVCGAAARSVDLLAAGSSPAKIRRLGERFGQSEAGIRAALAFTLAQAGSVPSATDGKLIKAHVVAHCLAVVRSLLAVGGAVSFQDAHPVRRRLRDLEAFEYADGPTEALYRSAGAALTLPTDSDASVIVVDRGGHDGIK